MLRIVIDNKEFRYLYDKFYDWVLEQKVVVGKSVFSLKNDNDVYICQNGMLNMCFSFDANKSQNIEEKYLDDKNILIQVSVDDIEGWSRHPYEKRLPDLFDVEFSNKSDAVIMKLKTIGSITMAAL